MRPEATELHEMSQGENAQHCDDSLWMRHLAYCLMRMEFYIYKMKRVLEMDGGDGCMTSVNVLNTRGLDTDKRLRW